MGQVTQVKERIIPTLFSNLPVDIAYLQLHHRTSLAGKPGNICHSLTLGQLGLCQTCSQHKYQNHVVTSQCPCQPHAIPTRIENNN